VELTQNPDAMISALRKIEGRGELPGATSAVMEMCVDNPREGFGELFDTHPTVENRVAALVKYAGGHDPGPIALAEPGTSDDEENSRSDQPPPSGPWSSDDNADGGGNDAAAPSDGPASPEPPPGPWGPHNS
jgi:heat shock protein HtpX